VGPVDARRNGLPVWLPVPSALAQSPGRSQQRPYTVTICECCSVSTERNPQAPKKTLDKMFSISYIFVVWFSVYGMRRKAYWQGGSHGGGFVGHVGSGARVGVLARWGHLAGRCGGAWYPQPTRC